MFATEEDKKNAVITGVLVISIMILSFIILLIYEVHKKNERTKKRIKKKFLKQEKKMNKLLQRKEDIEEQAQLSDGHE